jgi:hypothetical protein
MALWARGGVCHRLILLLLVSIVMSTLSHQSDDTGLGIVVCRVGFDPIQGEPNGIGIVRTLCRHPAETSASPFP